MIRWEKISVGDVCLPVKGVSPSFFNQNDEFEYIDIASIDRETKRIIEPSTIPSIEAPSRAKQPVSNGDVLVSTVRPNLNAVAMVHDYHDGAIASSGFCVLRPLQSKLLSQYLFFFTRTNTFVDYLNSLATGANYPAVSDKIVKSAQIPLPPLPEQQRIVERLDLVQKLIDQRKEQLKLMDALVQSLFYEMFGDPVKNEKGWDVSFLGELILDNPSNGIYKPAEYLGDGTNLIDNKCLYRGLYLDLSNLRKMRVTKAEQKKYSVVDGDILFNRVSVAPEGVGKASLAFSLQADYVYESNIMRVRPDKSKILPVFLVYQMNVSSVRAFIVSQSKVANQASINQSTLKKIPCILPPLSLQQAFADRVQQIEALKQSMTASLRELKHNFNALMQEAFGQ